MKKIVQRETVYCLKDDVTKVPKEDTLSVVWLHGGFYAPGQWILTRWRMMGKGTLVFYMVEGQTEKWEEGKENCLICFVRKISFRKDMEDEEQQIDSLILLPTYSLESLPVHIPQLETAKIYNSIFSSLQSLLIAPSLNSYSSYGLFLII